MTIISWSKARGLQVQKAVDALLEQGAWKATIYISPTEVVRATRLRYKPRGKSASFENRRIEIRLTIGRPNYLEREFVKACQKSGETFPVRKVQLKFLKASK